MYIYVNNDVITNIIYVDVDLVVVVVVVVVDVVDDDDDDES